MRKAQTELALGSLEEGHAMGFEKTLNMECVR